MAEQNEQPNEQTEQLFSIAEAAHRLGISRDAVRMRLTRGHLRGKRLGRAWLVSLPGEQTERTEPNRANNRTNNEQPVRSVFTSPDAARIAELERERDALAADKAWLQAQVESRGVELAEMRRLLGNAQQQAESMVRALPAPVPTATAEPPVTPPAASPVPDTPSVDETHTETFREVKPHRGLRERLAAVLHW